MLAGLVSGVVSLIGLSMVTFMLCPYMAFYVCVQREREREREGGREISGVFSYQIRVSPLTPHLALITSEKALSPNTVKLRG